MLTVPSLPHSWALYHYKASLITPSLLGTITTIEDFWCILSGIAAPSYLPPGECYEWRCMTVFPTTTTKKKKNFVKLLGLRRGPRRRK